MTISKEDRDLVATLQDPTLHFDSITEKRVFETLNDLNSLNPKDSKKREAWENRLYEWSEGFAKQITEEFNKL